MTGDWPRVRRALALLMLVLVVAHVRTAAPAAALEPESALAWGSNYAGQLGDGTGVSRSTPVDVLGLGPGSGVREVAAGGSHSVALKTDGSVVAWGASFDGQVGNNNVVDQRSPVAVSGLGPGSGVVAVAAGYAHSMALKSDGSVLAWGQNDYGQLGSGTPQGRNQLVPVPVAGLGPGSGVVAIAVGEDHGLALKSDGSVLGWGRNYEGQVGDGSRSHRMTPVSVSGLGPGSGVVAVSAGSDHSLARRSNGEVLAWGYNNNGQLGNDGWLSQSTPVGVSGLGPGSGVVAVVGGGYHSLALRADGSVLAWGANSYGELGDGTNVDRLTPASVWGLGSGSGVTALAADFGHSLAVTSDQTVLAWGANYNYQLGDGTTTNRPFPGVVSGLGAGSGVVAVSAGRGHNLALGAQALTAPAAPSSVSANPASPTSISVTWADNASNEDGFAITNGDVTHFEGPNATGHLWTDLAPGTYMCFRVSAFNAAGTSPWVPSEDPYYVCTTTPQASADIRVTKTGPPTATVGTPIDYTIDVVNMGSVAAPGVFLVDVLTLNGTEVGSAFGAATVTPSSQGYCFNAAGRMYCDLHDIAAGASIRVDIAVTPPDVGTLLNWAGVDASEDPFPADNTSTVTTNVTVERSPQSDVNGDGLADLLWYEANGDLSVVGGDTDGRLGLFRTRRQLGTPVWAGVGDVNGDGHADLLWYESNEEMSVIGGSSDGTLSRFHTRRQLGRPVWAGVGDVNGDGLADLLWYESNGDLSVIGGNTDGTLSLFHTRRLMGTPRWAGVGDVNGDGRADLLWHEGDTEGTLTVLGGETYGGLGQFQTFRQMSTPAWAGVGDVNGDARADLLWHDMNGELSVIGGDTDGTLGLFHTRRLLSIPEWAGVADINGDGRADLLWSHRGLSDDLSVMGGNADGNVGLFATWNPLPEHVWGGPGSFQGNGSDLRAENPTLAIGDVTINEGHAGTTNAVFTITRTGDTRRSSSVSWSTADVEAGPGDYVSVAPTTVNFAAGETSKTVTVRVTADLVVEPDERFAVTLADAWDADISDDTALGTILNDDSVLDVNDVTVTEGNSGPKLATFTITRTGSTITSASVKWATADGTATAGNDCVAVPLTTVTFNAGEALKRVSVTLNGDTAVEADETFSVRLSGAVGAAMGDGSGLGRITNDDSGTFSVNDVTVTEGNSGTKLATFAITRAGAVAGAASVKWSTLDAHGTAGSDYVAVPVTTLNFGPGETIKQVSVTVNGDTAVEPIEDFYVRLSLPTGATVLDGSGLGRISNDDSASFLVNDVTLAEGDAGTRLATFTITRSGSVGGTGSVRWSTANGTAVAGEDYTAVAVTTVNFAPGETTKAISVTVKGDTAVEAGETFQVRLVTPVGGALVDSTGLGRITNDDTASLSVNDATVVEGNAGTTLATFTISRSGAIAGGASVQWYTADGTATAPGDYVAVGPTIVSFQPGETTKTVSVAIRGDLLVEPTETFSVRLASPTSATVVDGSGLGRIAADD